MTREEIENLANKLNKERISQPMTSLPKMTDEEKLLEYAQIVKYVLIGIGIIIFGIGACNNEEILGVTGGAVVVVTIINFAILIPLFKVIVNISRNLKELNKKTK